VNDTEGERVVVLAQCRSIDPAVREALRAQVANLIRVRHGLEAHVEVVAPHSLPQTSSGKLSRSRARSLYLSGAFERPERVTA
jgi:fatty-acyl-CoA synthase